MFLTFTIQPLYILYLPILPSSHNLHHFDQLFRHARHHIAADTFKKYKNHITKQYEAYKLPHSANGVIDIKENDIKVNGIEYVKKVRVSDDEIPTSQLHNCSL